MTAVDRPGNGQGEGPWRVGSHYGIHVYQGDRPVGTFLRPEDAARAVTAVNSGRACFNPNCPAAEQALATPHLTSGGRHPYAVRAQREPCPVYTDGIDGWHCAVEGPHDQHRNAAGTEWW